MFLLAWFLALVLSLWIYVRKVYSKFSKLGVNFIKPVPFLGNVGALALRKRHLSEDLKILYDAFPNDRFVGRFEMTRPVVVIRDLDLIKQVTVKDFDHFSDRRVYVDETVDPLFGRSIVSLRGQEWRDMRSGLSPAFTGSKMRAMIPFMVEVSLQMNNALKNKLNQSKTNYIDVDSKDLCARYTNDIMASCGFGLRLDSQINPQNEFYLLSKVISHFGYRRMLVYLGYSSFPGLMKKLNIKFFSEEAMTYFENLFFETILKRKRTNIIRPDMIHLLLEAKKGNLQHDSDEYQDAGYATVEESEEGKGLNPLNKSWSDTDLIAQMIVFLVASFDSTSTTLCFLLYELAVSPDVQERLLTELKTNEEKACDYNCIQNLKYLDMVVSETLRMWPFGTGFDRACTKDYNLGKPNNAATRNFIVHEGEYILIPVWAIHRDPKYYPHPDKFDPERFSESNRDKIKPYSYMPFGLGPRGCIGSRFALLMMKVLVYHLLLQFEVSPAEKTRIPVKLQTNSFVLVMEGGHWIRFRERK